MKTISLKSSLAVIAFFAAVTFTSCKNKEATETSVTDTESAEPVVTTEGDTVNIDTSRVPLDTGKAKKPLIRKNSEDGTNSGL